ncbi:MAG: hypothetical protein AAF633_00265, partial [Chloroflexota bacterium]
LALIIIRSGLPEARMAALGAGLVFFAGLTKAYWKLNVVLTGQDITWLANLLFPLMAPGFIILAVGMWGANRQRFGRPVSHGLWLLPLVLIGLTFAAAGYQVAIAGVERGWFMPVMGLASLGNIGLTTILVAMAVRRQKWLMALLFVVNLGMVFALIPIAQIEPKTIGLHWFEQTLTTAGSAAFALASVWLYRVLGEEAVPQIDLLPAVPSPQSR